jgi:hypothetical protein
LGEDVILLRARIEQAWLIVSQWSRRTWVRWLVTAIVSLSVLFGIGAVLHANRQLLAEFEWQVHWAPLVSSFFIYSLALALAVLAWGLILNKVGGRVDWARHARIYCLTNLARRVPGVLWYVVGRVATYEQLGVSKGAVTLGSGLEVALVVLSGLIVSLATSPILVTTYLGSPLWLPFGFMAGLGALHPAVIRVALRRVGGGAALGEQLHYRDILVWMAVYSGVWLLGGLCLYSLIAGIYPIPGSLMPAVIGAWALSGALSTLGMFLPPFSCGLHSRCMRWRGQWQSQGCRAFRQRLTEGRFDHRPRLAAGCPAVSSLRRRAGIAADR